MTPNFLKLAILLILLSGQGRGDAPTPGIPAIPAQSQTCPGLGSTQGVTVYDGKVYIYGDSTTGVLQEFTFDSGTSTQANASPQANSSPHLQPTGRTVRLTRDGQNLLNHPTGLALHEGLPCFLGNTVTATKQGKIFRLDLPKAL